MPYKYNPRNHRKTYRWLRGKISKKICSKMTPERFQEIDKLYHYTSLKNGLLILLSRTMIMSHPSKMNDINESYRPIYCSLENDIEKVEKEIKKYYQSSFTLDDGKTPGFFIPAMWGHYADKGYGVCIVFDRKKLISRIESYGYCYDKVRYNENYDSSILVEGNPQKYIREHINNVFFTKSKDWSYEREYRVICRSNVEPVEIDISDCIVAVIVNNFKDIDCNEQQTNSPTYKTLINRLSGTDIPVLLLNMAPLNGKYELINYEPDINGEIWYPKQGRIKDVNI